jgi:hypothetical protein
MRLCQYYFAPRDCKNGCGDICIVAEPAKVNAENEVLREQNFAMNKTIADITAEAEGLRKALEKINQTALSHPYAGVTCGEIARAALGKA